ncbi:MAG TPA: malto-oligosyltrehalose trehalohydrolase [Candidatus Acidoferrum sp.]|nr:malto-oligosyltrehalose trehalohydrolase [Candidatus Acidoferrum sp.]
MVVRLQPAACVQTSFREDHLPNAVPDTTHVVGATPLFDGGWRFCVWAPQVHQVELHIKSPGDRLLAMTKDYAGFHTVDLPQLESGAMYLYRLDAKDEWSDPASRWQPHGVHGPSQIVDTGSFRWTANQWQPIDLRSAVLYELHVGTYTPEGTFDGVIAHLDELAELGVTTIEIMPVAQFPGERNWGYDGTYVYAPQNSYGGPYGLQRLVDAAHQRGLTVILDVVYNHIGPEGNYLGKFGRYFTTRYRTPWGSALNFDGPDSEPVRDYFMANALYWLGEYRFDGLRLDAIDGIRDFGARHFLAELKQAVEGLEQRTGMKKVLIAESDLNDRKVLDPHDWGGFALDAQWSDDFHHSVHTLLTGENFGYYADFGSLRHLAQSLGQGWHYEGQYSVFRRRRHGNSPRGISPERLVVYVQNHDQVGNRAAGERFSQLVDLAGQKLAAGVMLLSPFVPMLFMGEEYAETAPFLYFTSHGDADLIAAVRKGRSEESRKFGWKEESPDPQSQETFRAATLQHPKKQQPPHSAMRDFYKQLLALRKEYRLGWPAPMEVTAHKSGKAIAVFRKSAPHPLFMFFHFGETLAQFHIDLPAGNWRVAMDSSDDVTGRHPAHRLNDLLHASGASRHSVMLDMPARSFLVFEDTNPATE